MTSPTQDEWVESIHEKLRGRWPFPTSGPRFDDVLREVCIQAALEPIKIEPVGVGYRWSFAIAGFPYGYATTNGRLEDGRNEAHRAAIAAMEPFRAKLGVGQYQWVMYEDCMDYLGVPRKKYERGRRADAA